MSSSCPASLITHNIDGVFNFSSSSSEYVVVIYCSFNLYCTRMTNDVEHLCICLLVICISSFVKCPDRLPTSKKSCFLSPYWVLFRYLQFWIQTLYQKYVLQIFPLTLMCLHIHFLKGVFSKNKGLISMKLIYHLFSLGFLWSIKIFV